MAVTDEHWMISEAVWPETNSERVALTYDPPTDTLFADLFGRSLPAVTEPLDGSGGAVSLRIRQGGDDVVGVMVEGYTRHAVHLYPHWRDIASFAKTEAGALIFSDFSAPVAGYREVVVVRFLDDVKAIWVASVETERQAIAR